MNIEANNSALRALEQVFSGYAPGLKLIEGSNANAFEQFPHTVERFLVLRQGKVPRLILPQSNPAMRKALGEFLGNRPGMGLALPLAHIAIKLGVFSSYLSEISLTSQTDVSSPFRQFLCSVLGREDFHLALRLSFGRPNAKTVALAISHDGQALCFAKIGSEAMTNDLVAHEGNVLKGLTSESSSILTPRLLYSDVWKQEQHILITEPLLIEALPEDAQMAHRAADDFTASRPITTCKVSESNYWQHVIAWVQQLAESSQRDEVLDAAISTIEKTWGSTVFDFGACHGDWARANVGVVDGRVAAFDWERFNDESPRGIDTAHFAISECTHKGRGRGFDVELAFEKTRRYLTAAGRPADHAELLVILDCLQMFLRFMSARQAGVQSDGSNFRQALQTFLKK